MIQRQTVQHTLVGWLAYYPFSAASCPLLLLTTFSGANEDREMPIFPVQLATIKIGNLTQLILTLAIRDDHTDIHFTTTTVVSSSSSSNVASR